MIDKHSAAQNTISRHTPVQDKTADDDADGEERLWTQSMHQRMADFEATMAGLRDVQLQVRGDTQVCMKAGIKFFPPLQLYTPHGSAIGTCCCACPHILFV